MPADRSSSVKRYLLQNCFSNRMLGHNQQGHAICDHNHPREEHEFLELDADEETGYLTITCPHWHWGRGSPFVVKGDGKRNTALWPRETAFLERTGRYTLSENPARFLRLGALHPRRARARSFLWHLSIAVVGGLRLTKPCGCAAL